MYNFNNDIKKSDIIHIADEKLVFDDVSDKFKITVVANHYDIQEEKRLNYNLWVYKLLFHNNSEHDVHIISSILEVIDQYGRNEIFDNINNDFLVKTNKSLEMINTIYMNSTSAIVQGHCQVIDNVTGKIFNLSLPIFSLDTDHSRVYN